MRNVMLYMILMALSLGMSACASKSSDSYIRDRVLQLKSKEGSCSAVEIKSPSGKVYTLSAAHCSVLLINGEVEAINEQDVSKSLKMIKIDYADDLMLLEAFDKKNVELAKVVHKHEHVHVIAHGAGYPSYRTDGEMLIETIINIQEPVKDDAFSAFCEKVPGSYYEDTMFDGQLCEYKINVMQSSANTVGGASGGPALNNDGQLIGIVSCGDGVFSGFVPLHTIKDFLKDE